LKSGSGSGSVHGLFFGFGWGKCAPTTSSSLYNHSRSSESSRLASGYDVDDGLDGSINGLGLAFGNAGFGAGACTTFVDPWSGPSGAELDDACASDNAGSDTGACTTFVDPWSGPGSVELDDACASDDSTGSPNVLKYASARRANLSKCSNPRFPNTVITSLGMCTTSTHA
jgi:hypothetical protein